MSSPAVLDAARKYLSNGWSPVAVRFRQKRPALEGWQDTRLTSESLSQHFGGASNVGVLLGEPSGGLIDIDLDCREAVTLAPLFLRGTSTFGRDSNPRSHWLYTCEVVPTTTKYAIDGKRTLLELRSTGCQTVFPPSIYESGEEIRWDAEARTEPTKLNRDEVEDLLAQLGKLAAASYLLSQWKGGARDDIATALAGGLLRDGWAASDVDAFISG